MNCIEGNYDYGFYWNLYLDGTIEAEVKLTGIVGVTAIDPAAEALLSDEEVAMRRSFAPMIATNVASPVHQHLFCYRLDWELDGEGAENCFFEDQIETVPMSDTNPDGTQFRAVSKLLEDEESAKSNIAPEVNRSWKIVNRHKTNKLGKPVSYKVLPFASFGNRLESQNVRFWARGGHGQQQFFGLTV